MFMGVSCSEEAIYANKSGSGVVENACGSVLGSLAQQHPTNTLLSRLQEPSYSC